MSDGEIRLYETLLEKATSVLEYGCGGSTFIAAKRKALRITSVDSDPGWFDKLRELAPIRNAEADGRLCFFYADIGPTGKHGHPTDENFRSKWPEYSQLPWRDASFAPDLILVDGRFRVACILQSLLHMPKDANIVVHDFQRYVIVLLFLKSVARERSLAVLRGRRMVPKWLIKALLFFYQSSPR
jgi:hypothetical protein